MKVAKRIVVRAPPPPPVRTVVRKPVGRVIVRKHKFNFSLEVFRKVQSGTSGFVKCFVSDVEVQAYMAKERKEHKQIWKVAPLFRITDLKTHKRSGVLK